MSTKSDGSIIINTELDAEGFKKGSDKLRGAIKSLSDSANNTTKGFTDLEKEAASIVSKITKLQQQANSGFKNQKQLDSYNAKLKEIEKQYEALLKKIESFGNKEFRDDNSFRDIITSIGRAAQERDRDKLDSARKDLYAMYSSGGKFTGKETQEYEELRKTVDELAESLSKLKAEEQHAEPSPSDYSGWTTFGKVLGGVTKEALKSTDQFVNNTLKTLDNVFKSLIGKLRGLRQQTVNTKGLINGLTRSITSFKTILISKIKSSFFDNLFSNAKEGLQKLAQFSTGFDRVMSNLKNAMTGLTANISVSLSNLITAIEPILTSIINMVSRAVTYINALFGALSGKTTITVAKKQTGSYAGSLSDAASAAGDAADAQEDLNEALYGFDEINKRNDRDNSYASSPSSSGSNGGIAPGDLFETQSIDSILPDELKNFADRIKDAIAKQDWEGVGRIAAEGLNKVVKKIDDWNKNEFRPKAVKFAENIARTMNGFFEGWDARLTGATLGGLLNTAIETAYTWITTFDWGQAGRKLAEGINGLFDEVDWSLFGTTIGEAIKGFWEVIENWATSAEWTKYGKDIADGLNGLLNTGAFTQKARALKETLNGIIEFIGSFASNIDWEAVKKELSGVLEQILDIDIGDLILNLGGLVIGFIHSLAEAVEENKDGFVEFGREIGDALAQLDWGQLLTDLASIIINVLGGLLKGLVTSDSGGVVIAIAGALAVYKLSGAVLGLLNTFGVNIGGSIIGKIAGAVGTAGAGSTIAGSLSGAFSAVAAALPTLAGVVSLVAAVAALGFVVALGIETPGAEEAQRALKDISDRLNTLKTESDSGKYQLEADRLVADKLLERYQELSSKVNLTGEEEAELQGIVTALCKIYPGLTDLVDGQTGKFSASAEAISATVDELYQLALMQGAQEQLSEAMSILADASIEAARGQLKLADMIELRDAIESGDLATVEAHKDLLEECGYTYEDVASAIEQLSRDDMSHAEAQMFLNGAYMDVTRNVDAQQTAVDGLTDKQVEAQNEISELKGIIDGLSDSFTVTGNVVVGTISSYDSLKEMLKQLRDNGSLLEEDYNNLLQTINESEASGLTAGEALSGIESSLGDLGVKVQNTSGEVQTAMDEITDSMEQAADEAGDAGEDMGEQHAEGVRKSRPKSKKAAEEVSDGAIEGFQSGQTQAGTEGENTGDEYSDGLGSKKTIVMETAGELADTVTDEFDDLPDEMYTTGDESGAGIDSGVRANLASLSDAVTLMYGYFSNQLGSGLAANMATWGYTAGEKFKSGLELQKTAIGDKAGELITAITNGFSTLNRTMEQKGYSAGVNFKWGLDNATRNLYSDMFTAGSNAGIGLNNGLVAEANTIYRNVSIIANNVVNTMRAALKISSPSKVMEELGGYIDKGMAIGIDDKKELAIDAVANMAKGISDAAEIDDIEVSANSMTDGLESLTDRLSDVAQVLIGISDSFAVISTIPLPDILQGSSIPVKTMIGAAGSAAQGGVNLGGMASSMEEQNGLLRQQNELLQQLISVSGGEISVSSILSGIDRANRRAGKAVI